MRFAFLIFFPLCCLSPPLQAELSADYAFLNIITLSSDFSAARYEIDGGAENVSNIDILIHRLPYSTDLNNNPNGRWILETAVALQRAQQSGTFEDASLTVNSEWDIQGAELGLKYAATLAPGWQYVPGARLGVLRMTNSADYSNPNNPLIAELEGKYFNWKSHAALLDLSLGLHHHWRVLNRESLLDLTIHRMQVDSFNEQSKEVAFSEAANLASVQSEMIFPSGLRLSQRGVDGVLFLGSNVFFGENRKTLGYTASYRAGLAADIPIPHLKAYIRLSGQLLRASNMRGWLLSIGYQAE